jgi:hypothetical protein
MKYNKIIYTVLIAAALGATGCSKQKFEINSNPDDVTEAAITPSLLLPAAQQATATLMVNDFWFLEWWMGHGARSGSYQTLNDEETYKFTNDFKAGNWNALYANARNYHIMVQKAAAAGQDLYQAIGRIMRSHNFQMLVDIYNNIPYSEAFQTTDIPQPKYDKAIDVYKGILADLDAAKALLETGAVDAPANPDIATADFMFQGNVTRWLQFLNTLRLRVLVHLHNGITTTSVAPGINVAAEIAKVGPEGYLGAGQTAQIQPGFSGTKPTPYYRFYVTSEAGTTSQRDHLRASDYAIRYYAYDGDPRREKFYVHPGGVTANAKGLPFGTPAAAGVPTGDQLSTIRGTGYIPNGSASRAWILTSVESLFLQAEARQRNIITSGPSAFTLLTAAIRESFVWLGLTSAQADTYIANNAGYPDVDYNAPSIVPGQPGGGLFTILQQKWFALNMINPLEIWNDWRRTDIVYGLAGTFDAGPTISVDPGHDARGIPKRLFYPQNEYNYNAANVLNEGTINVWTNKIFWDLN